MVALADKGGATFFERSINVSDNPSGGGSDERNNSDCKAIYNGNLQGGWKVLKCNTSNKDCRCKQGSTKIPCVDVMNWLLASMFNEALI